LWKRVVREGRAAPACPQSAVSQRLRALEEQAGSVLVVRSRPLRPTRAGQLLLKHAQQLRLLRADLARDMQTLAPHAGRLRRRGGPGVAVNADSIATWALEALTPLVRAGLALEVITDDQDFTQEWLRSGEVLGCVTTLRQPLQGCRAAAGRHALSGRGSAGVRGRPPAAGAERPQLPPCAVSVLQPQGRYAGEFVARLLGLSRVVLNSLYLPNSEAQVRAVEPAGAWACCRNCWCATVCHMGGWSTSRRVRCYPSTCTGIAGTWTPACCAN
jgi:LysR family transcriptional regulator (chromosome initiation inhibitor)